MNRYAAGLLIAGFALAPAASAAQPAANDADFVFTMLQDARAQIAAAQLALERAQLDSTRERARRSTAAWTALQGRLSSIAYVQAFPTPGALDGQGQALLDRLGTTPPNAFDAAYVAWADRADRRAASRLQAERRSSNAALVALVNDSLVWFGGGAASQPAQIEKPDE
jgi:predicted outer membrane protein